MKKHSYALIAALAWSILIFILLIIPGQEFPRTPRVPFFDKIVHFFLFGVQVFLWCSYNNKKFTRKLFPIIFLLSSLYGIGMEYVQKYWVVNRSFEIEDIVADIAGSFAGWLVYRYYVSKSQKAV